MPPKKLVKSDNNVEVPETKARKPRVSKTVQSENNDKPEPEKQSEPVEKVKKPRATKTKKDSLNELEPLVEPKSSNGLESILAKQNTVVEPKGKGKKKDTLTKSKESDELKVLVEKPDKPVNESKSKKKITTASVIAPQLNNDKPVENTANHNVNHVVDEKYCEQLKKEWCSIVEKIAEFEGKKSELENERDELTKKLVTYYNSLNGGTVSENILENAPKIKKIITKVDKISTSNINDDDNNDNDDDDDDDDDDDEDDDEDDDDDVETSEEKKKPQQKKKFVANKKKIIHELDDSGSD